MKRTKKPSRKNARRNLFFENCEDRRLLALMTNGPGDLTVSVNVDGYGSFGSATGGQAGDANYDPAGAIGVAGTTFHSGVAIGIGAGARQYLTQGSILGNGNLPAVNPTGTPTSLTSNFALSGLTFILSQTLTPLVDANNVITGSLLTQEYEITNPGGSTVMFDMVRYLDGDLRFDGSLIDGGGRIFSGDGDILFETDTAIGSADADTFVGIQGLGGTIPTTNRFEISSFSALGNRIGTGGNLNDVIVGDSMDADEFIDAGNGYDVTLAVRNEFVLNANESTTYTARTFFGSGAPDDIEPPTNGTISGTVFEDLNNNGVNDFGEPRAAGWTVELADAAGATQTTMSNALGQYVFPDVPPATYTVSVQLMNGFNLTAPPPPGTHTAQVASGGVSGDNDFGRSLSRWNGDRYGLRRFQ